MKRIAAWLITLVLCGLLLPVAASAMENPYPEWQTITRKDGTKYKNRCCTWYCWKVAKERLGVEMPWFPGNAKDWLNGAINNGMPTGETPMPNSIAVYSGGSWGHVAFVTAVNGNSMTVIEGGRGQLGANKDGIQDWGESTSSVVGSVRWAPENPRTLTGFIYLAEQPYVPTYEYTAVSTGDYYIVNNGGGTYQHLIVDSAASYNPGTFNNANVSVWTGPLPEEQWTIAAAGDGYRIIPKVSTDGRVLNAYANYPNSGTNVNIQDDHSSRSDRCQWWKFEKVSGGYIIHNVKNPQVVLAMASDGHNVCVEKRTGNANQVWTLKSAKAACQEHAWGQEQVTKVATCTEDGEKKWICSACGAEKTETIPAAGHIPVTLDAVSPSCTGSGKTEGTVCYVCGATITAQEEIPALGHDYQETARVEPTAAQDGAATYTCSRCGDTYTEILPCTGDGAAYVSVSTGAYYFVSRSNGRYLIVDNAHAYDAGTFNNANVSVWTGPAPEEQWTVSGAGDGYKIVPGISTDGRVLNAYANDPVDGTNANIQDDHSFRSDSCQWWKFESVSGGYIIHNVKNPQVVLAVAGDGRNVCVQTRTGASNQIWALRAVQVTCREHAWDEGKTTKAAACQEPGERTFACIVCGETKTEEIAPLGHDYVLTEEQPAAVGKEGWKLYVCSRCGDEQKKAVPALEPDRLPGDVNGDGAVDGRDVLRLMKYFAGQDVTINEANADVTGDGAVDGRDVLRLMKYFAGQDVALI